MGSGNVYDIGKAFADKNYQLWDDKARRPELKPLYKANSELSFESAVTSFRGGEAIYDGVFGLIPQSTKHEIASVDVQGSADDMIVLVTGRVFLDGGSGPPLYFSEAFHLIAASPGSPDSLFILRDIIRVTKLQ